VFAKRAGAGFEGAFILKADLSCVKSDDVKMKIVGRDDLALRGWRSLEQQDSFENTAQSGYKTLTLPSPASGRGFTLGVLWFEKLPLPF
jgi:hypothetical protein